MSAIDQPVRHRLVRLWEKRSEKTRPAINSGYWRCYVRRKSFVKGGYWEVTDVENE